MRNASMHPRATLALTDLADTFAAQIRRLRIGGAACDTPGFVEAGILFLSLAGTVRDCQPMRANVRRPCRRNLGKGLRCGLLLPHHRTSDR